jgi:hypothetical protein
MEMILCTGFDNRPTKLAPKAFADEVETLVSTKVFQTNLERGTDSSLWQRRRKIATSQEDLSLVISI